MYMVPWIDAIRQLYHLPEDEPAYIVWDGHSTHKCDPVYHYMSTQEFNLNLIPAHSSHITQPLDNGCNAEFHRLYDRSYCGIKKMGEYERKVLASIQAAKMAGGNRRVTQEAWRKAGFDLDYSNCTPEMRDEYWQREVRIKYIQPHLMAEQPEIVCDGRTKPRVPVLAFDSKAFGTKENVVAIAIHKEHICPTCLQKTVPMTKEEHKARTQALYNQIVFDRAAAKAEKAKKAAEEAAVAEE
ncbi:DDE superfamily endonuclease, CENP-B-like [Kipferlia bialata]|uniref:DDE superfamily endonuclease, CENP-B-like n=1 Tax=Kipferlia bialata TaxID=797122 RepID=A0A391NW77_9EUKA|nr:DDE superfamily endonuclease, CENP-B-like [Kipferlia bialata]|eukprot:g13714.t1